MDIKDFKWTREPSQYFVFDDRVEIVTKMKSTSLSVSEVFPAK